MKVGLNDVNKPAPLLLDWLGPLIGGVASLGSTTANVVAQKDLQKTQIAHDKDMAGINQQNTLEQMERQNQYQVEQWNRENEYNDPSAVAARYRAAGISPQFALGGAASGAGISGGLSSGPSGSSTGSSSKLGGTTGLEGLASLGPMLSQSINQAETNKINRERMEADREKTYQEAKRVALENEEKKFMRDNGAWSARLQTEKDKSLMFSANAVMASIRSLNYDRENRADIAQKEAAADEMRAKINHYDSLVNQIQELTPVEKAHLLSLVDKYREEARYQKKYNDFFEEFGYYPDKVNLYQIPGNFVNSLGKLPEKFRQPIKDVIAWFGNMDNNIGLTTEVKQEFINDVSKLAENVSDKSSQAYRSAVKGINNFFAKYGKNILKNNNMPIIM